MGTRALLFALCGAALIPVSAAPLGAKPVAAAPTRNPGGAVQAEIAKRAGSDLRAFYAARGYRPLWLDARGPSPAASLLIGQLQSADRDRLKPGKLKAGNIARALDRAASGTPEDVAKAELALSKGYADYVKALRSGRRAPMIYETQALSPVVPTTTSALQAAARAPSLETYVSTMGWMHPLYAPLRAALGDPRYADDQRRQIALNLDRIRAIPANPARRYVLIDAASARLWMYQDGRPTDTMRVVVGKPEEATQTPMMAGFIRYAIVNPYWNVPGDLVRSRIAYNVLAKGQGYLANGGYQVLSDWSDKPEVVDPGTIDWHAVDAGTLQPRVRQLPGGPNFMGTVKFMFPNPQGIYLHDTPDKDLLLKDARQFSSGCVRLEDAQRLGRWLLGKPLPRRQRSPEQRIELPEVVPVYITYLTAMPDQGRIAFHGDVYARDAVGDARLARNDRSRADRP
ncbi:L,D-transpeptidase family protein [Novosphingobium sp. G106]|uniref:L,D-transpeptidase family protein n=1 Tax=Novosphingobium sp. G106 TaxID=2849500 RepID=UPI001C2DC811|nr:L,D-transpeptidase family protein [Novosphingobium sp. G106]MBV1689091.1 L,D-transpeptidase family protein [Novosphingobium sp. G106]